jgi:nitroreductase
MIKGTDARRGDHGVHAMFVDRWSPRAMSGEAVSEAEMKQMIEAARWAPSSMNEQPWRILYALREDPAWSTFFNLLVPANQEWCARAGALALFVAKKTFARNGTPNRTASYDTGSAWMSLALQGSLMGLVVHGMAGFDVQKARRDLNVPDDFEVMAMAAIGRPGDVSLLSETQREREKPSGRKALEEIALRGGF